MKISIIIIFTQANSGVIEHLGLMINYTKQTIMCTVNNALTVHCCKFSCSFCLHAVSMYLVISEFLRGLFRRVSFLKGLICGQKHESKPGGIMQKY